MSMRALAPAAGILTLLAFAGARIATGAPGKVAPNKSVPPAEATAAVSAAEQREIEIRFYADRVARDPLGAADRTRLAALFLERGRVTGSFRDIERAEAMARESLALRESHNSATYTLLSSILMTQHRFREALVAARRADTLEPGVASYRALIGEIALELGEYDSARVIFDSLRHEPLSDVATLRLARWDEISGHPDWAESALRRVLREWQRAPDPAPSQLAWLHLRLAELQAKDGRLVDADSSLGAGLRLMPTDYRLLGAAARFAAQRGRWRESIDYGERAIASNLEPTTVGVLSDASAARGDGAQARRYAMVMRGLGRSRPTDPFPHRGWSLWMLDHGTPVEIRERVRGAEAELRVRRDVYAYDLYAWALYKCGRTSAARTAMRQALRMKTRDPLLARHAAAIMGSIGGVSGQ